MYLWTQNYKTFVNGKSSGNVLCLCANCSANILHGIIETAEDIVQQVNSFKCVNEGGGTDKAIIKLKLCGKVLN